ncbi:MAG: MFS transporter [Dehalococcoidia bacterium]|nr:MAG: MFS transporter [Dehalococcoidia bacterium]
MRAPWSPAPAASTPVGEVEAAAPARRSRMPSVRTFEALNSRSFRWFFVAMLAQFSSMHMQMLVNPWLVFDITGSYARVGAISLASAIPGLILGFPGGVVADRAPKKIVVQIGQAVNAFGTLGIAVLLTLDMLTFTHLMLVSALQGGVFAIMGPARQAMIPEIVGPRRLSNAIGLNMAGLNVTRMGVPALGGFLLVLIGPAGVYYLMGVLILIAVAGLTPVTKHVPTAEDIEEERALAAAAGTDQAPRMLAAGHGGGSGARGLSDIRDGIRYMRGDPVVLALLWINFFIVLMSMPYMQMLAGFVKEVLHGGPEQIGFLISATGIGALAGSLVVASMPNRGRGKVFLVSALILGVALVGFVISTSLWLTAAIMLAVGFGQAGRMSLGSILIMSYTKPEFQGRVMSVYMMEFSLVSFGTFAVGILAEMVGIQWAIGSTAAALVIVSIYGLLLMPRVRDLP